MRNWSHVPKKTTARIAMFSLLLFGSLIYWHWEAMLISYLATRVTILPFNNIPSLISNSETKIALLVSAGQSVVRLGEFDKGLEYYEQALAMEPLEPTALKSLGALYLAQDKFDAALQNLDLAIENTSEDKELVDLFFNRGLVYLKMDNFEEAEYNFEEAYFLAPDDTEALLGLAKALEQAERWRKSRNYYMELIDKDPNDAQYYYGVYRTYFGEGRLEDAQEYLNKATALRGN